MPVPDPSRPRPVRTRLDPKARRDQLLDHAMTAFATSGIERAVHADVAELAGVSTPTVFKYFPTRDALVNAVLSRIEIMITEEVLQHIPVNSGLSNAELIHSLAKAIDQLCRSQPDLMKVGLAWSVAFSSVRERYLVFQDRNLDMLNARLAHAGADRSDARILLGVALLYIRMHFDGASEEALSRYVDRLAQLLDAAPKI